MVRNLTSNQGIGVRSPTHFYIIINMINLFVDDIAVSVKKNATVLQACDSVGIEIPRFCFLNVYLLQEIVGCV